MVRALGSAHLGYILAAVLVIGGFLCPTNTAHAAPQVTHVPGFTFHGDSGADNFGFSVSGAGDINGDGFADLIVGAPFGDDNGSSNTGSARVFSGFDGSEIHTFHGGAAGDEFGNSVSAAGDVNSDGTPDLIVGAPEADRNGMFNNGYVQVLSGADGGELHVFNGDQSQDRLGRSVSGAGDVNDDGFEDIIVSVPLDDENGFNTGSARVLSGDDGAKLHEFTGDTAFEKLAGPVSAAGDVNGDGVPDLIVGAPLADSASVFSGDGEGALFEFNGDAGERFGNSVSGAGDVNGDGFDDLIVGANVDNNNGLNSGSARVLSGFDGVELFEFVADSERDEFGTSVSHIGDVNDDGFDDLIVGAPGDDNNGFESGSARVLSGSDGSELFEFNGESADDRFGFSVSGAGDVNGDGIADFIVGAPNVGGLNNGGYARVFVSQVSNPVIPEPTTAALLGLTGVGLIGLGGRGTSRQAKRSNQSGTTAA